MFWSSKKERQKNINIFINQTIPSWILGLYEFLTVPIAILFLVYTKRVHPAYHMTLWRRYAMGLRFYWNNLRILSGTSYKAHLVMAMKLLEMPPGQAGDVVECGCCLGATSVNLSIVCKIVGRQYYIYDSFEGLPMPVPGVDHLWTEADKGELAASQPAVEGNVRRYGEVSCCTFVKGWFKDTLPGHPNPIALAFVDGDYYSSLFDAIINLWPKLIGGGYLFVDEYTLLDHCALFYSEKFWDKYFQQTPPGLIGAGSGIQTGNYYVGPIEKKWPIHSTKSIAWTWKGASAIWDYYPDESS